MSNTKPRVFITGATGQIGRQVIAKLAGDPDLDIIASSRNPEKANLGVPTVLLDYDRGDTVAPALQGVDRLFILTGYTVDMLRQSKALVDGAQKAGVKHIVHLGACGADDTDVAHYGWHQFVERYIAGSGIAYTHLRPEIFMENILGYGGVPAASNGVLRYYVGNQRLSFIAGEDIGTVKEYPTETSAMKAVEALRITINEEQPESGKQTITVGALITHFKQHELGPIESDDEEDGRSYATRSTYSDILDAYVQPKWGEVDVRKVRTTQVEKWLRKLKGSGKSKAKLARGSKAKIRSIMSVLFNHAIRHELMPQGTNPITMVRQSAKRMRTPDILEAGLRMLFDQLSHRERVMVLLDSVTGLRRSELMALKWLDVDFEQLEISVTRSIYRQVVGRCKTEISRKPVPLDP